MEEPELAGGEYIVVLAVCKDWCYIQHSYGDIFEKFKVDFIKIIKQGSKEELHRLVGIIYT